MTTAGCVYALAEVVFLGLPRRGRSELPESQKYSSSSERLIIRSLLTDLAAMPSRLLTAVIDSLSLAFNLPACPAWTCSI